VVGHRFGPRCGGYCDPFGIEYLDDAVAGFRLAGGQHPISDFDRCGGRSEASEHLGELHADRSRTEHDDRFR